MVTVQFDAKKKCVPPQTCANGNCELAAELVSWLPVLFSLEFIANFAYFLNYPDVFKQ